MKYTRAIARATDTVECNLCECDIFSCEQCECRFEEGDIIYCNQSDNNIYTHLCENCWNEIP